MHGGKIREQMISRVDHSNKEHDPKADHSDFSGTSIQF